MIFSPTSSLWCFFYNLRTSPLTLIQIFKYITWIDYLSFPHIFDCCPVLIYRVFMSLKSMLVLILIYTFLFISNILTHALQNNSFLFAARLYLNIWRESNLNEATMQHLLLSVTGLLVDFTLNCMLSKIVYIKETVYPKTQHRICRIKIHLEHQ